MSRKVIFFLLCFLVASTLNAQISVGLKESALGNSGAAITESSAPSFYNPALLSEKQKSYFSLTGTTLNSFKTSNGTDELSSTKFAPNYISSIHAFDSYIHEFSLVNQLSVDSRVSSPIQDGVKTTNLKTDQYNLLYSFAFRDFPFGFQLGLRINEQNIRMTETTNDGNIARGYDWDISQRVGHLFAGFGGIHQLGQHYRFGYKYESPGLNIYKKTDQVGSYYYYDKTNNIFQAGSSRGSVENNNFNTQSVTIGHSFATDDHEFLTDSRFTEDPDQHHTYSFFQTFGYKVNFANKMQYMCGFAHEFDPKSNYFSTGFSWVTNALRSHISAYYAEGEDNMQWAGFTFGSEFIY
ncbi:MAG: hypothetical protein NDI63_01115 [Pseudobdellovibrio sp.]|nr:hypothetical protein [Pseudobdellovibrio sp.]